jgi:hypothetical protein
LALQLWSLYIVAGCGDTLLRHLATVSGGRRLLRLHHHGLHVLRHLGAELRQERCGQRLSESFVESSAIVHAASFGKRSCSLRLRAAEIAARSRGFGSVRPRTIDDSLVSGMAVVIDTARWLTPATTNATLRDVLGVNGRLLARNRR